MRRKNDSSFHETKKRFFLSWDEKTILPFHVIGLAICERYVDPAMEALNRDLYNSSLLPESIVGSWQGTSANCPGLNQGNVMHGGRASPPPPQWSLSRSSLACAIFNGTDIFVILFSLTFFQNGRTKKTFWQQLAFCIVSRNIDQGYVILAIRTTAYWRSKLRPWTSKSLLGRWNTPISLITQP